MTIPKMEIEDLDVIFRRRGRPDVTAIAGLNLEVHSGEFVSIVGPSGCGKTTLLNVIAGLLPVESGLRIDGVAVNGPGPERAVVFQQPSLLPWRTVAQNIMYGLELQGHGEKREWRQRCQELIDLINLTGFERAYPAELSGGMQQRVNLARALAIRPQLLLLDEPFSALDAQTRQQMQLELQRICGATGVTAILVTHDIDEAVFLSNRVAIMTARPSTVQQSLVIDLETPRAHSIRTSPQFAQYVETIWNLLHNDHRDAEIVEGNSVRFGVAS